jgi:hypothetical protein
MYAGTLFFKGKLLAGIGFFLGWRVRGAGIRPSANRIVRMFRREHEEV